MHEEDFISASGDTPVFTDVSSTKKQVTTKNRKKARKAERKRKAKGRKK